MKKIFLILIFIVQLAVFAMAQEYTADDYDRLVKENPLVVVGAIEAREGITGVIKVDKIIKWDGAPLEEIPLAKTPRNLGAVAANIQYPDDHIGVWIIHAVVHEETILPADIVAHFIFPRSSVAVLLDEAEAQKPPEEKWGVTMAPLTKCYTRKGKMLGRLRRGAVLDIIEVLDTEAGRMALCKPKQATGLEQDFVVGTGGIVLYPGKFEDVDPEIGRLCVRDAVLRGQIEDEKERLAKNWGSTTSVKREYDRCRREHDEYWKMVKDLQEKRDSASDVMKIKYADQLRTLKGKDIELGMELKRAKEAYELWMEENPVDESRLRSAKLSALQKELKEVHLKLDGSHRDTEITEKISNK